MIKYLIVLLFCSCAPPHKTSVTPFISDYTSAKRTTDVKANYAPPAKAPPTLPQSNWRYYVTNTPPMPK